MGGDDLIRIIDAPLTKAEIKEVIAALQPLKEEIKSFSGISFFTKNTNGSAEFRAQATQLAEALNRIKIVEQELEALRSKNHTVNKTRTDQEIADTQRKAEATRSRVKDIRAEEDAYRKLTNEYNKQAYAVKVLTAQYGAHSKEAKEAVSALKPLAAQMDAVRKGADDSRSGVGRYAQGIKEFAKEALVAAGAAFGLHAAFDFIKDSVKEFLQQERALARFNNILDNVGRKDLFPELAKYAKEFAESLGTVKDEDVLEIFTKLSTYGKLTKNQMEELVPVIADFAQKTGRTLPEATTVFTAALEGTGKELKKEFGINMKDGANVTERFGIIMGQLKPKVDGAASALGDLEKSMKKSEIATEELKKKIGEEFAPALIKVENAILQGVKGIPEMVASYFSAFGSLVNGTKQAWFQIKALFGSDADLKNFDKQREIATKLQEGILKRRQANEEGESFAKDARKKTIADQEKMLGQQQLLLKSDIARYNILKESNQLNTVEGKRAQDAAYKSIAIVNALRQSIASQKDKRVVGNGDPNDLGKEARDASMQKEIEAQAKLYALRLQAAIDYQKILADEKNNTIASRLQAYNKLIELERQQVEGERDLKLKNAKLTEGERAVIIEEADEKMMKYRVDNIKRLAEIRYAAANDDIALSDQTNKEIEALELAHIKAIEDMRVKALAKQKAYLEDARNIALSANDRDFLSGKISKKKHAENEGNINFEASRAEFTDARDAANKQLSGNPNDATLQEAASKAQLDLDNLLANHKIDVDDKVAEKRKKNIDEVVSYAQEGESVIASFVTARYEKELNNIQKQIDANNRKKEKESAAISSSSLSIQEKAAAQIELDAKVNANNEALARRQRDIKVKEAKFDRDKAIFDILANTAVGIAKAIPNIPLEIAAAAAGAAALFSVINKPIPTYKTGGTQKEDGPMIVHPGEMRVDPDGKVSMTPDAPQTLTFGKRGTRIIPADEVNRMMLSDMMKTTVREYDTRKDLQEIKEAIEMGTAAQIQAMKRKQVIHNHIHFNPGFNDHINNAVRN